jgi:hypothetical protein
MGSSQLSLAYEADYRNLLARVVAAPGIRPRELALFWPKVGSCYDGDILVVGRAVNGWIDRWDLDQNADLATLAATARETGESTVNGDQLGWVLDRWKRRDGAYDTSTSQFWETVRRVAISGHPDREEAWPSYVAWSNLGKLAPWSGGNPSSRLLGIQREHGPALLRREVDELAPCRIVALTGRSWFEPFATGLGLPVKWRDGLVQGVAEDVARRWVIAVHPMTRSPRAVADAVLGALAK